MTRPLGLAISAAVLLALCAGCERKFTRQNFDMIHVGVDERFDVEKIIGKPTSTFGDSDQWYYEDEDEHYSALIHFAETGKVSGKQWMDGNTGEFSGNNPHGNPPPKGETRETKTGTRKIDN